MKNIIFVFISCLFFIAACSNDSSKNVEKFIETVPFPKSTKILDELETDHYKVVFYSDETGYRFAYMQNNGDDWMHTGNGEINPVDGFDWVMNNNPLIPDAFFGGIITDIKISSVKVKQITSKKSAKIIDSNEGLRYWFSFDKLESPKPGKPDPLKIEACDKNGKIVWKDGVYN